MWIQTKFKAWFLNFGQNCPKTATLFLALFQYVQLKLAGTKHAPIESLRQLKCLVMQETLIKIEYREIVSVRFESRDLASLETSWIFMRYAA